MKQFIALLAALGLGASATATAIACGNTKSETIVNKPNLSTLFNSKQIVVGINDEDDLVMSKILSVNKIDQSVFARNATFKFLDHRNVLISVLETDSEWSGDDVKINLLDNLSTASFLPTIPAEEADFDLSQNTIDVIKSKVTTELDWTALNISLDYNRNVFRITPTADSNKYWGVIEISYHPAREPLQSLISITDFTATKNATKTDVLNQLSALNNNIILDDSELEITDYNYQTDFTLTLTPKVDSDLYYGNSLTVIVRKNVNDLDLNGFAYNVDNDSTKTINQFKDSQDNLKVDWDDLDIQKTGNILTINGAVNNQKYSGNFTSVLWQPILFLDGYQADNNKDKIRGDLWKVNSPEVKNPKFDFDIDELSDVLKVYDIDHPEQNHITINYYERIDLATTITTTKLTGIYNGATEGEIKAAIIAQNDLTEQQIDAIKNQVDVSINLENNYFYLKIKDYANISTVFYGATANIAFDVQN